MKECVREELKECIKKETTECARCNNITDKKDTVPSEEKDND